MKETLTISKGNQYDPNGYYLKSDKGLYAFGESDGDRLTFDGTWYCVEHRAVDAVIRQVLADGQTRQMTVGEDAPSSSDHLPISEYPYGSRGSRDDCA